jgi:DNA-directed RNA polymerase specialized sigma24 family protein
MEAYTRCASRIRLIIFKLTKQMDYFPPESEILSEVQERWINCYDDIYEDDNQYLKYMFVVIKNKIRNLKKEQNRYLRTHISDPNKLGGLSHDPEGGQSGHTRVWNEMAVDHKEDNPLTACLIKEIVEKINTSLIRDLHREVFKRMLAGLEHKDIAQELGCSTGHVVKIKKDYIWPVVRDVMHIPYCKFDVLIDSGRIYSPRENYVVPTIDEEDVVTEA